MSLIDATYFTRDIALPASKYDALTSYISRYENQIIYKLFGYELGTLIIAYNVSTSPQRIKDIVEGKEYTISNPGSYTFFADYYPIKYRYFKLSTGDVTIKWNGLINTSKISLIAYWVYYWYCRENEIKVTNSGSAKNKLENANNIGFAYQASYAWNEMIKLYGYFTQPYIEPSCFNFLYENQDDYPEWVFESLGNVGSVNIYGI